MTMFAQNPPTEIVHRKIVRVPNGDGTFDQFDIAKIPGWAPRAGWYPVEMSGSGTMPELNTLTFEGDKFTGVYVPFVNRRDTLLEFSNRFSDAAFDAITDSVDADIKRAWKKFNLAQYIDRDDPQTVGFLDLMVAKGVITGAEKDGILA